MKILEVCEKYFEENGILTAGRSPLLSIMAIIKNVIIVSLMGVTHVGVGGGIVFIYFHHDKFEESVITFMAACGAVSAMSKYLALKMNGNEIRKLIEAFHRIVDEAPLMIQELYHENQARSQRYIKLVTKLLRVMVLAIMGSCLVVYAIYNITKENFDTHTWLHITYAIVPFERNTVMEYFVKQTIIVLGGPAYLTTMMTSTTFFINCHSLLGVGMSDMKSSFAELDEFMKHRGQRNLDELESRMIQIVELHNRLRKLAEMLSKIMSGPIFFFFLGNIGFVAAALNRMLSQEFDETSICVIVSISWISLYCYLAARVSERFAGIGNIAYQPHWYKYPVKLQKSVILIIWSCQEPVRFEGLGMFYCNLQTFTKYLRLIYTYSLISDERNAN